MSETPSQEQVQSMVDVWREWNAKPPGLRPSVNELMRRAYLISREMDDKTNVDYKRSVADERAVDLAISWLETIRLETLRDEPNCAERVQALINAAAHHIRIREAMQNAD